MAINRQAPKKFHARIPVFDFKVKSLYIFSVRYRDDYGYKMYDIVENSKFFEPAGKEVKNMDQPQGLGRLHFQNLGKTLRNNGIDFHEQCTVLEVSKPTRAAAALTSSMKLDRAHPF